MPPARSLSTSRILRMGNLAPGMPGPSKGGRGNADSQITQRSPSHPSTAWSRSPGMGGRDQSEHLVAINRNQWSQSDGARTVAGNIGFAALVDIAKLRWRIERDYQELKQEVGLGHFEGRGWCGFHHHATLCIAAYGFLISERETIPPCGPRSTELFKEITIPEAYRPRGSAIAA